MNAPFMGPSRKVMGTAIRNIIGRMDARRLLPACGSMHPLMV